MGMLGFTVFISIRKTRIFHWRSLADNNFNPLRLRVESAPRKNPRMNLDAQFEFLDQLPEAIFQPVVTLHHGSLRERVEGIV